MKHFFNGLLCAVMLLVMASCVNNIDDGVSSSGSSNIAIDISSYTLHKQIYSYGENSSADDDGEAIGVYVVLSGSNLSKTRYVSNAKYVCTSSGFKSTKDVYYPTDGKCSVISYYPYQESGFKSKSYLISVGVKTDQSSDLNYNLSDFMTAETDDVDSNVGTVEMDFKHRFVQVNVVINVDGDSLDVENLKAKNPEVAFNGVYVNADYNFSTMEFSNLSSSSTVIPNGEWKVDGKRLVGKKALVVPQYVNASQELLSLVIDGERYDVSLDSDYKLDGGTERSFVVDYSPSSTSGLSAVINDWEDGGTYDAGVLTKVREYGSLALNNLKFATYPVKCVRVGLKTVAIACRELLYNDDVKSEAVVVYPYTDGKPDLTDGYVMQLIEAGDEYKHGGHVCWDKELNTFGYTAGDKKIVRNLYFNKDGSFSDVLGADRAYITLEPYVVEDYRGDKRVCYEMVKIGTQFWTRNNLDVTKYADGTNITKKTKSTYSSATAGYYLGDDGDIFYNKNAVESCKLAPDGCRIANYSDWTMLKSYLHKDASLIKSESEWTKANCTCDGSSGFKSVPCGLFDGSKTTAYDLNGNEAAFWVMDYQQNQVWTTAIAVDYDTDDFADKSIGSYSAFSVRCVQE